MSRISRVFGTFGHPHIRKPFAKRALLQSLAKKSLGILGHRGTFLDMTGHTWDIFQRKWDIAAPMLKCSTARSTSATRVLVNRQLPRKPSIPTRHSSIVKEYTHT